MLLLENSAVKAEILPGDGGRLVSLADKSSGREFIWTNPRTRNLTRTHGANYDNLSAGSFALHAPESKKTLRIEYDSGYFKSLSVWMIYGGWRGHRCVMAEFFTGWPLKLSEAIEATEQGNCAYLEPWGIVDTTVKYNIF